MLLLAVWMQGFGHINVCIFLRESYSLILNWIQITHVAQGLLGSKMTKKVMRIITDNLAKVSETDNGLNILKYSSQKAKINIFN